MNALSLSLFDSVGLSTSDLTTTIHPAVATRRVQSAIPSTLWRQTLAAHEPAAGLRWAVRGGYSLLGALSAASVAYMGMVMVRCIVGHDGLNAAVQHLMGH